MQVSEPHGTESRAHLGVRLIVWTILGLGCTIGYLIAALRGNWIVCVVTLPFVAVSMFMLGTGLWMFVDSHRIGLALDRLVADWTTVYKWNPRLYRRVAVSGVVFGLIIGGLIAALIATVVWLVSRS